MELANLNTLLFGGKWALVGLVYIILIVVVISVRREMVQHTQGQERPMGVVAGHLKVINPGSDRRVVTGKILPLKPETRLGAETDNDLVLDDQFISRHHACLRWDGAVWWVEDLESSNGTTIDGQICPPHDPQPLRRGASLQLGDMIFELVS